MAKVEFVIPSVLNKGEGEKKKATRGLGTSGVRDGTPFSLLSFYAYGGMFSMQPFLDPIPIDERKNEQKKT